MSVRVDKSTKSSFERAMYHSLLTQYELLAWSHHNDLATEIVDPKMNRINVWNIDKNRKSLVKFIKHSFPKSVNVLYFKGFDTAPLCNISFYLTPLAKVSHRIQNKIGFSNF
ncbi:unnamed protein product [Moneuplotes crassus]|uniref:Uncharacterized protein n=1 Tax=Euplotes crassus TaxID=5936 RepID=A0AAD2D6S3_EUPCR|nr:unnamed protein product [Moneuplotes crassus]